MTNSATPAAVPPDTGDPVAPLPWLEEMPPRQIVAELNRYILPVPSRSPTSCSRRAATTRRP
jgi:hypothetical protein